MSPFSARIWPSISAIDRVHSVPPMRPIKDPACRVHSHPIASLMPTVRRVAIARAARATIMCRARHVRPDLPLARRARAHCSACRRARVSSVTLCAHAPRRTSTTPRRSSVST